MLSLATFAAGYWICQHVGMYRTEQGTDNLEIRSRVIAADIAWLWSAFLAICAFAVNAGRNVRTFTDSVALPWLAAFGVQLPTLPTLPQVPDRLTA